LLRQASDGEGRAVSAVEQAGHYLGIAVASTARVANVSAVVLGGHFAVLEEWIAPALRRSLDHYAPGLIPEGSVAFSGLGQTGALIGAAATSVRRILGSPYELIS
jgi:predicted NBD/HSP70 family sugar kinase